MLSTARDDGDDDTSRRIEVDRRRFGRTQDHSWSSVENADGSLWRQFRCRMNGLAWYKTAAKISPRARDNMPSKLLQASAAWRAARDKHRVFRDMPTWANPASGMLKAGSGAAVAAEMDK